MNQIQYDETPDKNNVILSTLVVTNIVSQIAMHSCPSVLSFLLILCHSVTASKE